MDQLPPETTINRIITIKTTHSAESRKEVMKVVENYDLTRNLEVTKEKSF